MGFFGGGKVYGSGIIVIAHDDHTEVRLPDHYQPVILQPGTVMHCEHSLRHDYRHTRPRQMTEALTSTEERL